MPEFFPGSKLTAAVQKHFAYRTLPTDNTIPDLQILLADFSSIPLRLRNNVPLIVSQRFARLQVDPMVFEEVCAQTLRFKIGDSARPEAPVTILVIGGEINDIRRRKKNELEKNPICLLGAEDVDRLIKASEKSAGEFMAVLASALRRDLGRKSLHPYQPRNPVVAGAFFGRRKLLGKLEVGTGSAVILGNRRMGKTSLLLELQRRLERANTRTAFLSGLNRHSPSEVTKSIAEQLLFDHLPYRERVEMEINDLPDRLATVAMATGKRFAVFFDELDKLIEEDEEHGWPVLRNLKVIKDSYGQYCRIFLAGFRHAMAKYHDDHDPNNPLANFGGREVVGRLDSPERKEMIEIPLRLLEMQVPPELYNVIDKATVGMPELIQICCSGLIDLHEQNGTLPTSDQMDEWIFSNDDYRGAVRYTFIRNTNPFERLAVLLLLDDALTRGERLDQYTFDIDRIRMLLRQRDKRVRPAVQLEDITRALSTASIIEAYRGDLYRFSLAGLGRFYGTKERIEAAIVEAVAETELHNQTLKDPWLDTPEDSPAGNSNTSD